MLNKFKNNYLVYFLGATLALSIIAFILISAVGTSPAARGDASQAYLDGISYTLGYALKDISMWIFIIVITLIAQLILANKSYRPYVNSVIILGIAANAVNTVNQAVFGYSGPYTPYTLQRTMGVVFAALLFSTVAIGILINAFDLIRKALKKS